MNRTDLINFHLNSINNSRYLEIGVRNGENFFSVNAGKKWGVDPSYFFAKRALLKALIFKRNWHFKMLKMTSDEFFLNEVNKVTSKHFFDVVFIDGLHTYEQSLKDAINSLDNLNKNGVIILHDCNPKSEKAAQSSLPIENINWNGDVWKTVYHFRKYPDFFDCFTIDNDEGLGVLKWRKFDKAILRKIVLDKEIFDLEYDYLKNNRVEVLGLKAFNNE